MISNLIVIFFLSGFISIILQTLLLREMLVVFQGNEVSIGLIISHWLIGSAAGSYLANLKRLNNLTASIRGLTISFAGTAVFSTAAFLIIRSLRLFLNVFPGEAIPLPQMIYSSFLIFFPLSVLIGSQFTFGIKLAQENKTSLPSGLIYLWESAGYMAGGIIFTYLLLPYLLPSSIVLSMAAAYFTLIVLLSTKKAGPIFFAAVTIMISILLFFGSGKIENLTLSRLYSGYKVLKMTSSPYGQLTIAERNGEKYFFSDGIPLLSLPNFDIAGSEEQGLLPLFFHVKPEKLLLIGGSGKLIPSILKHGEVQRLDYIESDPVFVSLLRKYKTEDFGKSFSDPRLKVHEIDGRLFVKRSKTIYDAIIIGLPYPSTLSLNRYFTEEFFREADKILSETGIIALTLPGSNVYINEQLRALNQSIRETLRDSFKTVKIIPGENNLFIASKLISLSSSEIIKKRFNKLGAQSTLISANYLDNKLNPAKELWLDSQLSIRDTSIKPNRDFEPHGLMNSLIYWLSVSDPSSASAYVFLAKYSWILWIPAFLWLAWGRTGFTGTAFTSGFAAMGLQMLSIWGIQVYSGYIYHLIGLITAVFMGGLAIGVWFIRKNMTSFIPLKILRLIEYCFCAWITLWWLLIRFSLIEWPFFFIFSLGSGIFLGLEFPLIVREQAAGKNLDESMVGGKIYAADLAGGWLASALAGTLLIPVWGFEKTILLILLLKVTSARWLAGFSTSRNY